MGCNGYIYEDDCEGQCAEQNDHKNEIKPFTRADNIRAMSDGELMTFLCNEIKNITEMGTNELWDWLTIEGEEVVSEKKQEHKDLIYCVSKMCPYKSSCLRGQLPDEKNLIPFEELTTFDYKSNGCDYNNGWDFYIKWIRTK